MLSPAKPLRLRPRVERFAESTIPTEYGTFRVVVYRERSAGVEGRAGDPHEPLEHCALVCGEVQDEADVLARVHSECLTGEVFHSLKCDCREQLDLAMRRIAESGRGVVLYLRQEGRGIGLGNKIRAYSLQERGADTVDANTLLGFDPDLRRYHVASAILDDLGVLSVALMTNNPDKVAALRADGIRVSRRVGHVIEPHGHNRGYLRTKRERMGHVLDELDLDAE